MSATPEELRATLSDLGVSVWTSTAIGVLYESGLVDHLREARSASELTAFCPGLSAQRIERCLAVAAAAGLVVTDAGHYRLAEAALPFAQEPMRTALRGDIRTTLMQALALLDSCSDKQATAIWRHTDRELLQSQGDASAALAPMIKGRVAPALEGLEARLNGPGARFLDVGVGVGALALTMCRVFGELRVVGLDIYAAPLEIARENVARAGLSARVELRQTAVEALADQDAYDLAWVPSFFIPAGALGAGLARVRAALHPGGWVLLGIAAMGDDRQRAARLLVNDLWAGAVLSPQQGETLLQEAGFAAVRTLPGPAWAASFVVGQR